MAIRKGEFELKRVVVTVYAPVTWSDKKAIDQIEGNGWDLAVKRLPEIISQDMAETLEQCTHEAGLRIEVTT